MMCVTLLVGLGKRWSKLLHIMFCSMCIIHLSFVNGLDADEDGYKDFKDSITHREIDLNIHYSPVLISDPNNTFIKISFEKRTYLDTTQTFLHENETVFITSCISNINKKGVGIALDKITITEVNDAASTGIINVERLVMNVLKSDNGYYDVLYLVFMKPGTSLNIVNDTGSTIVWRSWTIDTENAKGTWYAIVYPAKAPDDVCTVPKWRASYEQDRDTKIYIIIPILCVFFILVAAVIIAKLMCKRRYTQALTEHVCRYTCVNKT